MSETRTPPPDAPHDTGHAGHESHGEPGGRGHDPYLAHHFDTPAQQSASGKLGMWAFLATEILMFGGLFCAYAVYRANHPEIFIYAHQFLDKTLGGINTIVLICSSLTMAWGVRAAQLNQQKALIWLLSLTLVGACGFLGIKYVEYKSKWEHGLLWASQYEPHLEGKHGEQGAGEHLGSEHADGELVGDGPAAKAATPGPAADTAATVGEGESISPEAQAALEQAPPLAPVAPPENPEASVRQIDPDAPRIKPAPVGPPGLLIEALPPDADHAMHAEPRNVGIFFSVYFLMTGLHGIHVLVGMGLIAWILVRSIRREFNPRYFIPVDLVGLYWHLVDLIWIFLFPLLYLIH